MEFKGELVRNLLRILTPEEIADLTISSSNKKKVSLSLILESSLRGENYKDLINEAQDDEDQGDGDKGTEELGTAKILPFNESEGEDFKVQTGQRVHALLEQYSKVFLEMDKKVLGPKRFPKVKRSGSREQMSTLILEQKKKLLASYSKIKSMEVLSLYKDSHSVELKHTKGKEEDFSPSSRLGVLVNKKQA